MFDPRNNLSAQVVADVRSFMGEKVYETMIPRNVRVSEAPSHGKPVLLYDLKCAGSQAYLRPPRRSSSARGACPSRRDEAGAPCPRPVKRFPSGSELKQVAMADDVVRPRLGAASRP